MLHKCIPCDKTFLSIQKNFDFVTLTLTFDLLLKKNSTLATTFEPKEIGLSYFTCVFLVAKLPVGTKFFYLVTLALTFDLLLKKLNLDHNFWSKSDRALILHKCIPCDKTFLSIQKILTFWHWPWLLTYFWKNSTLATTFEPKEIGLSYFACVFLVARPSCWNQNFLPRDLDFWPTFEKT